MEEYKAKLRRRMQLNGTLCGLFPLGMRGLDVLIGNARRPLGGHETDFMRGLMIGFAMFIIAMTVFNMVRIRRALRDEALLKRMYIAETDERAIFIRNKVGGAGIRISIFVLMVAAIIACYFNMTVTYSLIGAAMLIALIKASFKLYYRAKY